MKKATKLFLMLLVMASMLTITSCNKDKKLPEKITVSGQVTYENGDAAEGVAVEVVSSYLMAIPTPVDLPVYTNEEGRYLVEFEPKEDLTYSIRFNVTMDDCQYSYQDDLTKWEANQVCDAVLKKNEDNN